MSSRRVISPIKDSSSKFSMRNFAVTAGLIASGVSMNFNNDLVQEFENKETEIDVNNVVPQLDAVKLIDESLKACESQQVDKTSTELEAPVGTDVESQFAGKTPATDHRPEIGLELSAEMKEIEETNRKFTERFDRLVSENFENRYTDSENAVLQRRKRTFAEIFANVRAAQSEVLEIRNRHKLTTPEQMLDAENDPTTVVVNVADHGTGKSSLQPLRFTPEKYKLIKDFVYSIEDGSIEEIAKVDPSFQQLITLKHDPLREQEYILAVFYKLAGKSPAFHHWIFQELDENHPLYSFDGTLDQSKLPSDKWTMRELKGGGQVPILKEDEPLFPTLADRWFFNKVSKATPLDRRFMAKEFDMQGDSSRVGLVIKIVQNAIERYWKMVRPYENDRAYYFDLEEDVPFDGAKAQLKPENPKYNNYYLSREMAQLLFVPARNRPLRYDKRLQCINLALNVKQLKSFASSGGEIKQDDFEDPDAK